MSIQQPAVIQKQESTFNTALTVMSNQKESVAKRAEALRIVVDRYSNDLSAILPPHINMERMKQQFILSVKNTPKLLECDPGSLVKALITSASMGLEPDPYFGQVYLIPYGKNVQVIPGYKGLMKLVRNTGEIASIQCEAVHINDYFDYELGSDPKVVHKPALKDRGEIQAFYCVAKFKDGSIHVEWMNKEEIDRIKNMSSAVKGGKQSPWGDHYEEMGKKTVFRRAVKRLPISLSRELSNAIQVDDGAHNGRIYQVDEETGELIDVWATPSEEEGTSTQTNTESPKKLESFAGGEVA